MTKREKMMAAGLVALLVIAGIFSSIFAPAYKSVTKENTTLKTQRDEYQAKFQAVSADLSNMKASYQKAFVSGSIREPLSVAGQVAYREVKWKSLNISNVKESVKQALSEVVQTASGSVSTVFVEHVKEKTVVKRGFAEFGAGVTTDRLGCGSLRVKILGPLGAMSIGAWKGKSIIPERAEFLLTFGP